MSYESYVAVSLKNAGVNPRLWHREDEKNQPTEGPIAKSRENKSFGCAERFREQRRVAVGAYEATPGGVASWWFSNPGNQGLGLEGFPLKVGPADFAL